MSLLKNREVYKPFEYPKAFEFWEKQQNAFWLPSEVSMAKDIKDWNQDLTESEKLVIGQILKSFTQVELNVEEYWSNKVGKWFPKPEVQMMANAFANMETVHVVGYSYLNDSLGLKDYDAFLQDSTAVSKINRLKEVKGNSKRDIARSLAIFSAFTEGVSLFSSFAILMNLSRYNLLTGVKNIVEWSIRDENLHSNAGCWLFNTFISENKDIWDDELKKEIYEAARVSVQLEDDFVDNAFKLGVIRGLDPKDLKQYIRKRANLKLQEIGLKSNWKNLDETSLKNMEWFDSINSGVNFTDFFSHKVTDYTRSNFNVENLFGE
jgi:ribonucleoside-diphosphate reductase beta chain